MPFVVKTKIKHFSNISSHISAKKIWKQKKWPKEWTKSLVIPLPKKGNLKQCQNYRTISLISHPSKVMLRVILNRLKSKAEELLSEEQAGFRAGRSTVEQISTVGSSLKNTYNIRRTCSIISSTSGKPSTEFGMMVSGKSSEDSTSTRG